MSGKEWRVDEVGNKKQYYLLGSRARIRAEQYLQEKKQEFALDVCETMCDLVVAKMVKIFCFL